MSAVNDLDTRRIVGGPQETVSKVCAWKISRIKEVKISGGGGLYKILIYAYLFHLVLVVQRSAP